MPERETFDLSEARAASPSLDDLLARAEQALADLQGEFEAGLDARLREMTDMFAQRWRAQATREAVVRDLRRMAHDIKGEAGSFGYPLIGDIAEQFSNYLRATPTAEQMETAVRSFLEALHEAWTERLRGDGGQPGRRLRDRLGAFAPEQEAPAA